jgi:membrane protease YdiL (CAAX protease family)
MSATVKALLFYALTLGMSLAIALLATPYIGELGTLIVMVTPTVAVLLMQLVFTRDGYTRRGWSDLALHRTGWRVLPLTFGGPLLILGISYGIVWATGIAQVQLPGGFGDVLLNAAMNFGVALIFCLGEEIGWRGYLLPKLQRYGTTAALLITGFLQAVWHLPFIVFTVFYHGDGNVWIVVPLFVSTMTVAGVFFGYLRIAGKSTWPAAIAHAAFNAYWNVFAAITVASSPLAFEYLAGESGLLTLLGTAIAAIVLVRRLDRKTTPAAVETGAQFLGRPLEGDYTPRNAR